MVKLEELKELYGQAKYREIIAAVVDVMKLETEDHIKDAEIFLQVAWAYHQLGEYEKSIPMMETISRDYGGASEIGESALRGLAHGLLQKNNDIERSDSILRRLPLGLTTDNIRMNQMIVAVRKGLTIPVEPVIAMIQNSLKIVPYATINGHILNNGAMVLYEAREQEAVKAHLAILPGCIFAAIGIYMKTGTAKNHLAGATFRASQICEAVGWMKFAKIEAETSVGIWRELNEAQAGERYAKNLEGALAQLAKVTIPSGK
jgi:hypothetical protein